MYIAREIEGTIDRMLKQGKVVLVTGARQVGKTTVLREHLGSTFDYVTMEDPAAYVQAKSDAVLFSRCIPCRSSSMKSNECPSCSRR